MHVPPVQLSAEINPLNLWNSLRTELLWTYAGGIHPSNLRRQSDHTHGYWVWLLLEGQVRVTTRSFTLDARAGQWLVSPHGVITQDFSPDASILSLHFSCQWPTGDNLFAGNQGLVLKAAEFPSLETTARGLLGLVQSRLPAPDVHFAHQPARYSEFLQLQLLFIRWLEAFADAMKRCGRLFMHIGDADDRLMHAVRTLNETPLETEFPAAALQHDTGLGRAHLDRLFFQTFGATTHAYWDRRRIDSARTLLGTTRMPIKEAAFRLGFKQASHFTKWFHRHCSITPQAYRQRETLRGDNTSTGERNSNDRPVARKLTRKGGKPKSRG